MLKLLLVLIALAVVAFLVVAALQPAEYRVTRSTTISAPAATVFSQVNDFHNWQKWSPWAELDPAMSQTYEGTAAGSGAVYTWSGNKKVGEGRMTITESHPNDLIRIALDFIKPFSSSSVTEFAFVQDQNQSTSVTWSMFGKKNLVSKAFGLFMSMDKMIGPDFERGLARLKSVSETAR